MYKRYNYYYDKKTKQLIKKAGEMKQERKKEPERFIFIGSWFAHQQQPFILENAIYRNLYNKNIKILDIVEVKK